MSPLASRHSDRAGAKASTPVGRKWRHILLESHETRMEMAGVNPGGGPSPREPVRLRVVKQRDRLGVGDRAALDHRERLAERDLEDLDMLVLVDAATLSGAVRFAVGSDEAG